MATGKGKGKAKVKQDCIRCPDHLIATTYNHNNEFKKCQRNYSTLNNKYQVSDLWWGFTDGPIPNNIAGMDLENPDDCQTILEAAKNACPSGTAETAARAAKAAATLPNDVPITKGLLEKAMRTILKAEEIEEKPTKASSANEKGVEGAASGQGEGEGQVEDGPSENVDEQMAEGIGGLELGGAAEASHLPSSSQDGNSYRDQGRSNWAQDDTQGNEVPQRPKNSLFAFSITRKMPKQEGLDVTASIATSNCVHDPPKNDFRFTPKQIEPDSGEERDRGVLRKDFAPTTNASFQVYTNHFKVTLPSQAKLYEYTVKSLAPEWTNATRNKRKVFMKDLIDMCAELRDNYASIATDFRSKIIAIKDVISSEQEKPVAVPCFKPGTREGPKRVELVVELSKVHDLDGLNRHVAGKNFRYEETGTIEALNIIIAKGVSDGSSDTFQSGNNNKFYYRPGWQELGYKDGKDKSGLIAIRGYSCSLRPSMGCVTLNINTATSAFYRPQLVHDYFDPFRDRERNINFKMADRYLKGLRAYVNFNRYRDGDPDPEIDNDHRRTKTIRNIDEWAQAVLIKKDTPATEHSDEKYVAEKTESISVWDHLSEKYGTSNLDGYEQVAVNVGGKPPHHKYYLSGQMLVLGDQLFREKVPSHLVANMIRVARRPPLENRNAILKEGLSSLGLNQTPLPSILHALNIQISPTMILVPARRVEPPTVQYGPKGRSANLVDVNLRATKESSWSTEDQKYVDVSRPFRSGAPGRVHFLHVDDRSAATKEQRDMIIKAFMKLQFVHGIQQLQFYPPEKPTTLLKREYWDRDYFKSEISVSDMMTKGVDLVVLLLPRKDAVNASRYATFKSVCEQDVGIKSAVYCEENVVKKGEGKMQEIFGNATMKLNLRLGNINHVLRPDALDPINSKPLDCMILGADVTHPGGGSVPGTPSIAAVVGSLDERFALFPGSMRCQTARKEEIEEMKVMVSQCLKRWSDRNMGRLPSRVLYYRDGVGDSQYSTIRNTEIPRIRAAWEELARNSSNPPKEVKITALIVAKRHNTRFYPKDPNDKSRTTRSRNVQHGTVVDSSVTSPYFMDFYLQSHDPISGSGKPAHYFVLENEMEFEPQRLQNLTNNLCYLYERSTSPVSYAPPAYYADRLCERGRQYLKEFFDGIPKLKEKSEEDIQELVKKCWSKAPNNSGNPWQPDLNGTMFWM